MNSRNALFIAALLLALAATASCEDTDVTAPVNSTITLSASNVFIDEAQGETEGETDLVATVVDAQGIPLDGIPLFFTTTGGLLLGKCNENPAQLCFQNAAGCTCVDKGITTSNANGVATSVLKLRLIEDPDQVMVTVKGTNLEASRSIFKTVNLTVPEGSAVTLTASNVFINQDAGETEGSTDLVAQVVGPGGNPLPGVPLFFTSTGGLLASGSGGQITAVTTDANGVAIDELTLRLNEDPDEVTVTVKGTGIQASRTVSKVVNLGPVDPVANIDANPPDGQRLGLPFQFDGSGSTFDPQVELECFEWSILSSKLVFDSDENLGCAPCPNPSNPAFCRKSCVGRGPNLSVLTLSVGDVDNVSPTQDQDLAVTLRVSDDPTISCVNGTLPQQEDAKFSPFPDTLSYQIRCDLTDPIVEAGNNQSGSLASGPVSFNLQAIASDPEYPNLSYQWTCGAGTPEPPSGIGQSITCTYDSPGPHTAIVTVTNDCQRQASDSVTLTVNN